MTEPVNNRLTYLIRNEIESSLVSRRRVALDVFRAAVQQGEVLNISKINSILGSITIAEADVTRAIDRLNILLSQDELGDTPLLSKDIDGTQNARSIGEVTELRRGDVFVSSLVGGKPRPWISLYVNEREGTVLAIAMSSHDSAEGLIPCKSRFWPDSWTGAFVSTFTTEVVRMNVSRPYDNMQHLREIEDHYLKTISAKSCRTLDQVRQRMMRPMETENVSLTHVEIQGMLHDIEVLHEMVDNVPEPVEADDDNMLHPCWYQGPHLPETIHEVKQVEPIVVVPTRKRRQTLLEKLLNQNANMLTMDTILAKCH